MTDHTREVFWSVLQVLAWVYARDPAQIAHADDPAVSGLVLTPPNLSGYEDSLEDVPAPTPTPPISLDAITTLQSCSRSMSVKKASAAIVWALRTAKIRAIGAKTGRRSLISPKAWNDLWIDWEDNSARQRQEILWSELAIPVEQVTDLWGTTGSIDPQVLEWRCNRITRFTERQQRLRDWISFAEIATAAAHDAGSVQPEERLRELCYQLLLKAALAGDFCEASRSRILFLSPRSKKAKMTRKWLVDIIKIFHDHASISSGYLRNCWIPRHLCWQWYTNHNIRRPQWLPQPMHATPNPSDESKYLCATPAARDDRESTPKSTAERSDKPGSRKEPGADARNKQRSEAPEDRASRRNRYEAVHAAARRLCGRKKRAPDLKPLAEELSNPRNKLGFKRDTIRQILNGTYSPAKKMGFGRVDLTERPKKLW